ncbi:MAG: Tex-like N-terminal domain-containing protein, partial [Candidatus Muiribacteriota bacterium]
MNLVEFIRQNTELKEKQVDTVVSLLDEGNTIPFIARYRKDKTDNLDEVGVKTVKDKLEYFREIQDRKQTVINTITELGKMTDELMNKITNTFDKLQLEDLYAPYKPKKTTRAAKAKEAGLEKLTGIILNPALRAGNIEEIVTPFINAEKGYDTVEKTINGACDIIAENIADNADIKGFIRNSMLNFGNLSSKVKKGKEEEGAKYQNYFEFSEKVKYIPSHRILAIFRGENEKILSVSVDGDDEKFVEYIKRNNKNFSPLFSEYVNNAMEDSYKRLIKPSISNEIRKILKERADFESVKVFSDNLRALLMSAPLGTKKVLAVDPGIRTGAKLAVISETGDFLEHTVLYWNTNNPAEEKKVLGLISKYEITHIGVGNGTGGRELREYFLQSFKKNNMKNMNVIMVNESGASIYSASDSAREEFGELDLTVRGAISIGRRLQDPLAELVKITPESIGVGQYQHDVDNSLLKKELKETVEFCVNKVGVNLNTASKELLSYVSGVSAKIAKNIIEYREKNGMFKSRKEIKKVTGLGPKAFEQAAG